MTTAQRTSSPRRDGFEIAALRAQYVAGTAASTAWWLETYRRAAQTVIQQSQPAPATTC